MLLLERGADPDQANHRGTTPRALAQSIRPMNDYTDLLPASGGRA
jgi:hypothetical protein